MATYRAGTIVARNYLAQARVLARSFQEFHPDIPFSTLVIDGTEETRSEAGVGTVVLPYDLQLDREQLHSMMLIYNVMELSTALKAAFLTHLLTDADAAIYFDPDIRIYAPLGDVFRAAVDSGIVLTPHTVHPVPRDGRDHSERTIMHAGMYNLGFIGVAQSARPFLEWWHERLAVDAVVDITNALFTDQRWVDWVPSLFPSQILRDQGLNVAYWNLHERPVTLVDGSFRADAALLRFFHFSGYDPERPWALTSHLTAPTDRPRILLSESPALRVLCAAYCDELLDAGHAIARHTEYGLATLPTGLPLTAGLRQMARLVLKGEIGNSEAYPDAFDEPELFARWLTTPAWGTAQLTPAQWSVWVDRPDLRAAFEDPLGEQGEAFLEWCSDDAEAPPWLAQAVGLAGAPAPRRFLSQASEANRSGWSILGAATAQSQDATQQIVDLVALSGVPHELVEFSLSFDNVISVVDEEAQFADFHPSALRDRRGQQVGVWFWEPDKSARSLRLAGEFIDEIWTTSDFSREAIQAAVDRPVRKICYPIDVPERPTTFSRAILGMPERAFVFMTSFDFLTSLQRKNPAGVISAYLSAFAPHDGTALILMSTRGDLRVPEREYLKFLTQERPDIHFMECPSARTEARAMIELADSFVSLHRVEGYGRDLADAFGLGTPTIATGYSGNLEYMSAHTSSLVPFSLTEVSANLLADNSGMTWAEPNLDAAAEAMRRHFDDRSFALSLAESARRHATEEHSWERALASVRTVLLQGAGLR